MIRLFGVVHAAHVIDLLLGERREVYLEPTPEMAECLRRIPPGSRVGIEYLSPEDFEDVRGNLNDLAEENGLRVVNSLEAYWPRVYEICQSCGHEILWLEETLPWMKYNQVVIELGKIKRKYSDICCRLEEESDRDCHKKLVSLNEERYRADIRSQKIHFLERDDAILRNIASKGAQAVIAGLGHTDAWMLDPQGIKEKYGISFGEYSTEDMLPFQQRVELIFREHAVPDSARAYDFAGLKKSVRLVEEGRFSSRQPDWVGTWNVIEPSKGYFELFIEGEEGEILHGKIEDSLGTAEFTGHLTPHFVSFVKSYGASTREAIKTEINYDSKYVLNERQGHPGVFESEKGGDRFYIERFRGRSPFEMSLSWFDLACSDKSK